MFLAVYGAGNALADWRTSTATCFFAWELRIPFVAWTIVPYLSIDLFFVVSFFLFDTTEGLATHSRRLALATAVAGASFVLFPLTTAYPRPAIEGWTEPLFAGLWRFDRPHNLAPSLHVAFLAILWPVYARRTRGIARRAVDLWFALVAASTLLTWQHHVIDVATGAALAAVCFFAFPDARPERLASGRDSGIAARYAAGAALLLAPAAALGGWWWLLAWPALAISVVALAYAAGRPDAFRKVDGRVAWSARVVLAPYTLGARRVAMVRPRRPPARTHHGERRGRAATLDARDRAPRRRGRARPNGRNIGAHASRIGHVPQRSDPRPRSANARAARAPSRSFASTATAASTSTARSVARARRSSPRHTSLRRAMWRPHKTRSLASATFGRRRVFPTAFARR
jgi:membrane-associated phospholipid phosphatase